MWSQVLSRCRSVQQQWLGHGQQAVSTARASCALTHTPPQPQVHARPSLTSHQRTAARCRVQCRAHATRRVRTFKLENHCNQLICTDLCRGVRARSGRSLQSKEDSDACTAVVGQARCLSPVNCLLRLWWIGSHTQHPEKVERYQSGCLLLKHPRIITSPRQKKKQRKRRKKP